MEYEGDAISEAEMYSEECRDMNDGDSHPEDSTDEAE